MSIRQPISAASAYIPKRIVLATSNIPCPTCGSTSTGAIAKGRYFCADCCTEFTLGQSPSVYAISSAGTVQRLVG